MRVRVSGAFVLSMFVGLAFPVGARAQVELPEESSPLNAIKRLFCANFDTSQFFADNVGGGAVITPVSTNLVNSFLFQSQTFPNVSSAAGFTFSWIGGAPVASELYGPLFGERATTNGREKLSATLNFQQLDWATYDDQEIRLSDLGLDWGDLDPEGLVPSDPYRGVCNLNIRSRVLVLALNYGLTDNLDISAGIPLVSTTVSGTSRFDPAAGVSVGNLPPQAFAASGEATGIGDIGVSLKYGVIDDGPFTLALKGGVALGTGSADKMTGTGQTVLSGLAAAAWESGPVSVHGQLGYSASTGDADEAIPLGINVFDEVSYVLGLDYAAIPERLTLGTEVVARHLIDTPGFDASSLTASTDSINVYFISVGGKVRVVERLLLTSYLLIPAGNQGLLPQRPSFNIGLNHVF
jgi:hypothetical protein